MRVHIKNGIWIIEILEIVTDEGHTVEHEEYIQTATGTLYPRETIIHEVFFGVESKGTYNSMITIFKQDNTMYVISYQVSDEEHRSVLQTYQEIIETFKIVS